MRFGKTLRDSAYPAWKDSYIDYRKLKRLLRDGEEENSDAEGGEPSWTEDDENRFCDELFNVQLEKVAQFQERQFSLLRDRTDAAFEKLKELPPARGGEPAEQTEEGGKAEEDGRGEEKDEATLKRAREIETELDSITNEIRALKRFSGLNYTGFLKIAKKHDRRRGEHYRVRPMMQVSLTRRPFNSEAGYSPLLAKLSLMYAAVHQYLHPDESHPVDLETHQEKLNGHVYRAHRFWVHPDNLLEVKTMILRHLPALVYSDSSAKEADATADPTLTSLYFDNKKFELYNQMLDQGDEATSLRLRWFGQLVAKPPLSLEEKIVHQDGKSEEHRIPIKDKYVQPFLEGKYHMEKSVQKMERQSVPAEEITVFGETAAGLQELVASKHLEPVLRANYVRTAFQKPADNRVRVSVDTNLAFIREDNLDGRRLCRGPSEWHRRDIDAIGGGAGLSYPFADLPPSDVSCFPYAVLEIKLREGGFTAGRPAWVEDLMASHLVHPAPQFSKFVHGAAVLFDDYVNRLPFWLSDLDRDIRRDPQEAFTEEELRRAQRAADEQAVGSLLGTTGKLGSSYKPAKSSPVARSSSIAQRMLRDEEVGESSMSAATAAAAAAAAAGAATSASASAPASALHPGGQAQNGGASPYASFPAPANGSGQAVSSSTYGAISSVLPSFSMTRYAKWQRHHQQDGELPEGVTEPTEWLKNAGPLRIEPKVWLANERTFLKWQHIAVLLGSLAVALFSAASSHSSSSHGVATTMGLVYVGVAVFAAFWGWHMLHVRREMIVARSGRDFDNMIGPVVVSVALMTALLLNLLFSYRAAFDRWAEEAALAGNGSTTFV